MFTLPASSMPTFIGIPVELRLQIYQYTFQDNEVDFEALLRGMFFCRGNRRIKALKNRFMKHPIKSRVGKPEVIRTRTDIRRKAVGKFREHTSCFPFARDPTPPITVVNRTSRAEALPVYFRCSRFLLHQDGINVVEKRLQFLTSIARENIFSLHFSLDYYSTAEVPRIMRVRDPNFPQLRHLHLDIKILYYPESSFETFPGQRKRVSNLLLVLNQPECSIKTLGVNLLGPMLSLRLIRQQLNLSKLLLDAIADKAKMCPSHPSVRGEVLLYPRSHYYTRVYGRRHTLPTSDGLRFRLL